MPENEFFGIELPDEEFVAVVDEPDGSIAEIVYEADPVLLAAVDQARAALAEITPAESIGELVGHAVEGEHVLSLFFASNLAGYPDWHWTATLTRVSDTAEPSVLEVELLPGEGSLLSPAWVPWADRLSQDALVDDSESEFDDESDDDESDEDEDDEDEDEEDDSSDEDDDEPDDDLDDDPSAIGLRRDRDGIDIDTIAEEGLDAEGFEAHAAAAPTPDPVPLVEVTPSGVDPDAGSAFDATDDFADAGDIEDLEGRIPQD